MVYNSVLLKSYSISYCCIIRYILSILLSIDHVLVDINRIYKDD